ncbi:FkbM family methyltransferase [Patescibacteria group bacterium]|nr:FkbM family methyltransferase [Patescibacteria group bacterium]
MKLKNLLRRFGYDVRRYYPFWETVALPRNITTVLDIGANNGEFSKEIFTHVPKAEVYAFEPLSDCFTTMQKALGGNSHFHAFNTALGDTTGQTTIQRSSFHPSSSLRTMAALHKILYPKTAGVQTETIGIVRLDDIMKDISIKGTMMIKIDVQGFEDKVIAGGTETFKRASLILIETSFVELYEGQPLFGDIHDQLRALGFSYYGSAAEHRNLKTGELLYQDSIFVRN